MPDQYTSTDRTLGELLSMTSPYIEVPEWQRDYSWDTTEVETFWLDLNSFSDQYPGDNVNDQQYFLGSIVIVEAGTRHILLDGQQRLATATILISVIRDYLAEYTQDAAARTSQRYITDFDDASGTISFKLTLNRFDREFFRREVQEITTSPPEPTLLSHDLIRRARNFFKRQFEDQYQSLGRGRAAFDWSLRIQNVLTNHVSVVAVSSSDEDNAAAVFETLNDRGIGLSTPDLLRNLLLRRSNDSDREEVIACWGTVLELDEDASVDDFLRHFWLSRKGDVKTRGLYREIKGNILKDDTSSLGFSRDLQQTATLYRELVTSRDDDPGRRRLLENINMLGARLLFPAILSIYDVSDGNDKIRLLSALVTLYVRHNVIGRLENSRLETIVFDLAKRLRQGEEYESAIDRVREFAPSDDTFLDRFKVAEVRRVASARYILQELEYAKRRTRELAVELPDRVHVEHIYPKQPEAGSRWPNHGSMVDRLGNLTLLAKPLNQAARNKDFGAKSPYYEQSELLLTQELQRFDNWDGDSINNRQEEMSEFALATWRFPE